MKSSPFSNLQKIISLALLMLILTPLTNGQGSVASQITAMPAGARIEVRLKNNQRLRGTRGPVSNAEFTLIGAHTGGRQIVFDDVVSARQLKSHTTRNVLIVVGIAVATLGITFGILLRCGPFGCGKKTF